MSALHEPAVDADHLSGDVRRRVGSQERHQLGHLLAVPEPADGDVAQVRLARRRGHPAIISVSISPGDTALTSTPFGASSRESDRVRPMSPAFDAA